MLNDIVLREATPSDLPIFGRFTFPCYAECFDLAGSPSLDIRIAEFNDGRPAGLLVASVSEFNSTHMCLRSISVDSSIRRRGLGHHLLSESLSAWRARNIRLVNTVWTSRQKCAPEFESLLRKSGFQDPEDRNHFFEGSPEKVVDASWFPTVMKEPATPYKFVPWREAPVTTEQAIELGSPDTLTPDFRTEFIDPDVSQVLTCDGSPVGWSLVHDLPERGDGMCHSRTWVHPNHLGLGRGFQIMMRAVRAQFTFRPDRPIGYYDIAAEKAAIVRMHYKRLVPQGFYTYASREATISFYG